MFRKVLKAVKSPEVQKIKELVEKDSADRLVLEGTSLEVTSCLEGLASGKTVEDISEESGVEEEKIQELLLVSSDLINAFLG